MATRVRIVKLLAFAFSSCGVVACGDGEADEPRAAQARSVVLYGAREQTELTPFPSNRYTRADASTATGLRVDVTPQTTADEMVTELGGTFAQLSTLDGFSTTGGVFFKLSAPIDARGIDRVPDADPPVLDPPEDAERYTQPDAPFLLVNVDDASPEQGQAMGIVPRYFEQAADDFYTADEFTVIAQPARPLLPATRYVLVVTRALRARDQTAVGASPEMSAALTSATDDYSVSLREAVASAASAVGFDRRQVVAATVFTTASTVTEVARMAEARRAAPDPTLEQAFTIETPYAAPDPRVRFVTKFSAPEFRHADGKWRTASGGAPEVAKSTNLEAFLAFSDATQSGPRPVVFYAHGLGGDKDGCWGTAQRLTELSARGVAVIAIDSPEHGSRSSSETNLISSVYGFFGIDQETNAFDIERARDNFRQMAADQLELVRFTKTLGALDLLPLDADGNPAPDGVPDLDVSRFYYIGHSFGSVQGPSVFALAPEIEAATWNVGGAGLMMLLRDSNLFSLVLKSFSPATTPFGAVARFMAASQAVVDPGDPLNFARYAAGPPLTGVSAGPARDVLLQEVVDDTIVPNSTSEALARAVGLSLVHPVKGGSGLTEAVAPVKANLPSGGTGVICQFDRADGKVAAHGELIFSSEARQQYVEFFKSHVDTGQATVVAPY